MLTGRRGYHGEDVSETLAAVLTRDVDWTGAAGRHAAASSNAPARLSRARSEAAPARHRRGAPRARSVDRRRHEIDYRRHAGSASACRRCAALRVCPHGGARCRGRLRRSRFSPRSRHRRGSFSKAAEPPRLVTRAKYPLKELSGFVALSRDGTKLAYAVSGPQGLSLVAASDEPVRRQAASGHRGNRLPDLLARRGMDCVQHGVDPDEGEEDSDCGRDIHHACVTGRSQTVERTGATDDTIVFAGSKGLQPRLGQRRHAAGAHDHRRSQGRELSTRGHSSCPADDTCSSRSRRMPQRARSLPCSISRTAGTATIAKGGDNGRYVPTGHLTFVREGTLFAVPFDLDRLTVDGRGSAGRRRTCRRSARSEPATTRFRTPACSSTPEALDRAGDAADVDGSARARRSRFRDKCAASGRPDVCRRTDFASPTASATRQGHRHLGRGPRTRNAHAPDVWRAE